MRRSWSLPLVYPYAIRGPTRGIDAGDLRRLLDAGRAEAEERRTVLATAGALFLGRRRLPGGARRAAERRNLGSPIAALLGPPLTAVPPQSR